MSKVRLCFLGTPQFALTALEGIIADEHYELVGVVTQPDRPAGRKMKMQASAVKTKALELSLPILCPEKLNKDEAAIETMRSWAPDIAVVVAFGQILSEEVLSIPTFGSVNLHASLLPRWRGAAPIQRAIESGDSVTGVALQKMVKRLDAGDVIGVRSIDIDDSMDAIVLHDRLAELGVELLHVELMDYIRGHLTPTVQDEKLVTFAKKLEKSESHLNWQDSARNIFNKIRAFQLGPGCFAFLENKKIKIHKVEICESPSKQSGEEHGHAVAGEQKPGQPILTSDGDLVIATGDGYLRVLELQPESKPRMKVESYLSGHRAELEKMILTGGRFE